MAKPTAKDKRHFARVVEDGCILCGGPAEIHHDTTGLGMGQRDHSKVIALCPGHHRYGTINRHGTPKEFAEKYGPDAELLEIVEGML